MEEGIIFSEADASVGFIEVIGTSDIRPTYEDQFHWKFDPKGFSIKSFSF